MIDELDIFANVGRVTAHDEYVPFQIKNNRLVVKGRSSAFSGKLKVTFKKIDHRDNPKVNAVVIWKGSVDRKSDALIFFDLTKRKEYGCRNSKISTNSSTGTA